MHHKPKIERLKQDTSAHTSKAEKRSFPIFFCCLSLSKQQQKSQEDYESDEAKEQQRGGTNFVLVLVFFISATAIGSFVRRSLQSNEDGHTRELEINRFSPDFCSKRTHKR